MAFNFVSLCYKAQTFYWSANILLKLKHFSIPLTLGDWWKGTKFYSNLTRMEVSFKLYSELAQYPLMTCVSIPQSLQSVCDSGKLFYSQSHLSQNCCFHLTFMSTALCGARWLAKNPSEPFLLDEHPLLTAHGLCECSSFGQVEASVHTGHSYSIIQIHLAPLSFMHFFYPSILFPFPHSFFFFFKTHCTISVSSLAPSHIIFALSSPHLMVLLLSWAQQQKSESSHLKFSPTSCLPSFSRSWLKPYLLIPK